MNANDSGLGAEAAEIARLSAEYDALFLLNAGHPHPPDDEQNFEMFWPRRPRSRRATSTKPVG